MRTYRTTASFVFVVVVLAACGGLRETGQSNTGGGMGNDGKDAGEDAGCNYPKVQSVSEPCCEKWGLDACGAALFCAAFDGRSVSTCYPNRSRMVTETCQDDSHCVSNVCTSPDGGSDDRCQLANKLGAYEFCRNDDYCLNGDCSPVDHMCLGVRGTACLRHDDCSVKFEELACSIVSPYTPISCQKVLYNEVCRSADDCVSKRCIRGACESAARKFTGEACVGDTDCISGHCYQKVCQCLKYNGRGCADGTKCTGTTHVSYGSQCDK